MECTTLTLNFWPAIAVGAVIAVGAGPSRFHGQRLCATALGG